MAVVWRWILASEHFELLHSARNNLRMPPSKYSRELKALTNGMVDRPTISIGRTRSGAVYNPSARNTTPPEAQLEQPAARATVLHSSFEFAALPQAAIKLIMKSLDIASIRQLRLASAALRKDVALEIDSIAFEAPMQHLADKAYPGAHKVKITGNCPRLSHSSSFSRPLAQVASCGFSNMQHLRLEHMHCRVSVAPLGNLVQLITLDLSR